MLLMYFNVSQSSSEINEMFWETNEKKEKLFTTICPHKHIRNAFCLLLVFSNCRTWAVVLFDPVVLYNIIKSCSEDLVWIFSLIGISSCHPAYVTHGRGPSGHQNKEWS